MSEPVESGVRRSLRVLLVVGAYVPELSSGGLQCQAVARCLAGQVEFRVLATAVAAKLATHETIDGVPVSRVRIDVRSRRSRARATARMIVELMRIVPRVDLVHIHGFSQKNIAVTLVAKLFRRPLLLSLHTAGHDEPDAVASQGRLAAWAFFAARRFLAVSRPLMDACLAAGLPSARIRLVPNGVDLARFRPLTSDDERARLRASLGLDPHRPVILFVGFFSREKQPQLLFDAWWQLQREPSLAATLLFVGATRSTYFEVDESLAAEMRVRADGQGLGGRLIFVEPTSRVEEYYRAADLFALPSTREGLPVALLEAMATGIPAIASRLPGATDVLVADGETGLLVPPGDVAALADALRTLLADRPRAVAMGAAARLRAMRDYGVERTAAGWLAAYRELSE